MSKHVDRYTEIKVGDNAEIIHTITQQDVKKFVNLTGDDNKLHTDKEYSSLTSFKKPVVHGMLGASFISTVIGTKIPGDGALWFSQNLEFLKPVRVGDKLKITAEVIKKVDRTKTIELKTNIQNQNKELVTTGISKVKVISKILNKDKDKDNKNNKKNVLVIGATGGIGAATCLQLAEDGFNVAIHCHKDKNSSEQILKKIQKKGQKSVIVYGNILDEVDVGEIKYKSERSIGKISTIVNCATISIPNIKFSDLDWNDIQSHFDINLKSSYNLLKAFMSDWENDNFGKFIGLTTLFTEQLKPELLGYITSKSALNGFVKALAHELGPKGIRLNLVSPGMVNTQLIANIPEKISLLSAAQTPLRSLAEAKDVANVIAFLASHKSNYLTGETIRVNGGKSML
jgi:3-oxoacyl-[acyl-carrier protein] reductase